MEPINKPPITRDEAGKIALRVKEHCGVFLAKELIRMFSVERMVNLPESRYAEFAAVANKMIEQPTYAEAARALMDAYDERAILPSHGLTVEAQRKEQSVGHVTAHYTPNDVISMLLQIAFKAEKLVATTNVSQGNQYVFPHTVGDVEAYKELCEELGVLSALPFNVAQGDEDRGSLRAKRFLASFLPFQHINSVRVDISDEDAEALKQTLDAPGLRELVAGVSAPVVGQVFTVRSYDDKFVEDLLVSVADISSDGRRFRACAHLFALANSEDESLQADVQNVVNEVIPIQKQMDSYMPSLNEIRQIVDLLVQRGLIADDTAPENNVNLYATWEVMRQDALAIARLIVEQYREHVGGNRVICKHCCAVMPDDAEDTLAEQHASDCVVNKARQFIEDTDV
jgi:hypothetical protein